MPDPTTIENMMMVGVVVVVMIL